MSNGVTWSKAEINQLVLAARDGARPEKLAEQFGRTPEAVVSKAQKLGLKLLAGSNCDTAGTL